MGTKFDHNNYHTLGNFSLVKYYQILVTKAPPTNERNGLDVILSPISSRTRGKTRQRQIEIEQERQKLQEMILKTPTKQIIRDRSLPALDNSPEVPFEASNLESSFEIEPSPISREAELILYPRTKDEQIVTLFLITLLTALSIHFDIFKFWTPHRKAFVVSFLNSLFEARVDGYLEDDTTGEALAIIEVKPYVRKAEDIQVRVQEAAQIVAWLVNSKHTTKQSSGRYFQISQSRHQIFIIFAEYDEGYLEYLKEGLPQEGPAPFLTLYEYGAWDINSTEDMEAVGLIILALSLRAKQLEGERRVSDEA
ncbi:hypothetical protein F5884DRAFT_746101 [Xylogone sp. PMI_703]|nr:hypothetical protein F5884DRAFT_746101 [Xylogone sp. PMI_703]